MSSLRSPLRSALYSPTYDPLKGRFGGGFDFSAFTSPDTGLVPVIAADLENGGFKLGGNTGAQQSDIWLNTSPGAKDVTDEAGNGETVAAGEFAFDWRSGSRRWVTEMQAATNLCTSPFAPATQSPVVLNATKYTASCRGAGSIALSGGGAGTVTEGSPVTFTTTSASVTMTVTGPLSAMQLELFDVATSFVDGMRAEDVMELTPAALDLIKGHQFWFYARFDFLGIGAGGTMAMVQLGQSTGIDDYSRITYDGNGTARVEVRSGGSGNVNQHCVAKAGFDSGLENRISAFFDLNDVRISNGGAARSQDPSSSPLPLTATLAKFGRGSQSSSKTTRLEWAAIGIYLGVPSDTDIEDLFA